MAQLFPLEEKFPLQECVLDVTRSKFVREEASTVASLVEGSLSGRNRFRRLLLGCKAVGKTTLLKSLLTAAQAAYPDGLLTLYVSYADTDESRLAVKICRYLRDSGINPSITDHLQGAGVNESTRTIIQQQDLDLYNLLLRDEAFFCKLGITAGMADLLVAAARRKPLFTRLSELLRSANKRLFLVVDELQNVYTGAFPEGQRIIDDVRALGEDTNGQIHCIISGSSTYMRRLAFGNLPSELKPNYPNYTGVDLNNTKYQARWIYPFLDVASFRSLYCKMVKKLEYELSEEETAALTELFIQTGGSPGGLSECVQGRESSTYHISTKSVMFNPPNEKAQVLRALYKALPRITNVPDPLAIAADTTCLISTHLAPDLAAIPENILYDMADAGLIRYVTEDSTMKQIGFGSPLVYFETAMQGKNTVTSFEVAALCYPCGPVLAVTAEKVASHFLADAFQKLIQCLNPVKYSDVHVLNQSST